MSIDDFLLKGKAKGFCSACNKNTESLHKCPDCGKYVYRPPLSEKQFRCEIRNEKRRIRLKHIGPLKDAVQARFKDAVKAALKDRNKNPHAWMDLLRQINDEIDAAISDDTRKQIRIETRAYLAPGVTHDSNAEGKTGHSVKNGHSGKRRISTGASSAKTGNQQSSAV